MRILSCLTGAVRSVLVAVTGLLVHAVGGSRVLAVGRLFAALALGGCLLLLGSAIAYADSCPNAQLRTGYSAYLPDCRGYEQVSPVDKNGGDVAGVPPLGGLGISGGGVEQAAASGEEVTFDSIAAFGSAAGAPVGNQYLATRGGSGWSTQAITAPSNSGSYNPAGGGSAYKAFSDDLSVGLLDGGPNPPLAGTSAPPGDFDNLYLRDAQAGSFQALLTSAPAEPASSFRLSFLDATPDLKHVAMSSDAALAPGSSAGFFNVYEWSAGRLSPVNVLPGDSTTTAHVGDAPASTLVAAHAISDDGSKVFWTDGNDLYLRDMSAASTVQVDAPAADAVGHGGGGQFWHATGDGSSAILTDDARAALTADTIANSGDNLYEYDSLTGGLTDVTAAADANVLGVVGASDDNSYVYFVANGGLAPGALAGTCQTNLGSRGTGGLCNLYVRHAGVTKWIATLQDRDESAPGDTQDWVPPGGGRPSFGHTARVADGGQVLVFTSVRSLTGYDNTDAVTGQPDSEVYRYDVASGDLTCLSCNPTGAKPTGPSELPAGSPYNLTTASYLSRVVSSDGQRAFFDSSDALVPRDTDGAMDVYEWEAEGEGNCGQPSGCVSLISGGQSGDGSSFVDASHSGDDVFFISRQPLVAGDDDPLVDLYDARVNGGFASPVSPGQCSGDACRSISGAPPSTPTAASVTFSGPGNAPPSAPVSRVRILTRVVHGAAFTVRVKVPGKGRVTISGAGIKRVGRFTRRAGTYQLRLMLTASAMTRLRRRHKLHLRLRVADTLAGGGASAAVVRLTVKPAVRHHARSAQPGRRLDSERPEAAR